MSPPWKGPKSQRLSAGTGTLVLRTGRARIGATTEFRAARAVLVNGDEARTS